ncbi:TfoX/Sxy family protein [Paraburkholderia diazotrophica]|uniref:TfoX N-terminal domain-containing protein n=1 Tax=Paraburkholderia diazotrophica TaxID=667676 RepID=A0A1H6S6I3_9BURK|nr:TfoX/Sxy family protein [Paraburkholderia diazotrophica]SEI63561.1 TfoX N-terminal domain-containing protein [Paraburkholderia diazotrophica]
MATLTLEHSAALLVALRVVACRYDAITERKFFGCPAFFVGRRMAACVYGDTIALKLPQLSVTTLLETRGCKQFQPYRRYPMLRWLAFDASSPAFASLEEL